MAFLDELRALTEEREAMTDRVIEMWERRGVPSGGTLVASDADEEVLQLIADQEDLAKREAVFWGRFTAQP